MDKILIRETVKEIYRCCDTRATQIINEANEIDNSVQLIEELEDYIKERDDESKYKLPTRDSN